jgi:hypothetical protein
MKKQFTLNRTGTFRTKLSVSNQCKAPGHKKYVYSIKAICGTRLDEQGFVIDHVRVDHAVQTATKKITSCERLCEAIAGMVRNTFKTHGAVLHKVHVTVQPFGKDVKAYMEYVEDYK